MAASEHSQHGRGQLREKPLGHLGVCVCVCVCIIYIVCMRVCVCTRVRGLWLRWLRSYILIMPQLDVDSGDCLYVTRVCLYERRREDWICRHLGLSYLPLTWPLPLPGCRGVVRRRFMEWTTRLAWCPRGAGGACREKYHWPIFKLSPYHFKRPIDQQTSSLVFQPDLYPSPSNHFWSIRSVAWIRKQSNPCFLRYNKPS